jgi:hypothetical protein
MQRARAIIAVDIYREVVVIKRACVARIEQAQNGMWRGQIDRLMTINAR